MTQIVNPITIRSRRPLHHFERQKKFIYQHRLIECCLTSSELYFGYSRQQHIHRYQHIEKGGIGKHLWMFRHTLTLDVTQQQPRTLFFYWRSKPTCDRSLTNFFFLNVVSNSLIINGIRTHNVSGDNDYTTIKNIAAKT